MSTKWQSFFCGAILLATWPPCVKGQQAPTSHFGAQAQAAPSSRTQQDQSEVRTAPPGRNRLNLTPDQRRQLRAIRMDRRQRLRSLRNDTTLTVEQKHEQFREIRRNSRKQVMVLLTPEQRETWKEMVQERRERRRAAPSSGSAASTPALTPSLEPANPSTPQ
jgi:Spy/CpxP family protein refolding chaperone